MIPNQWILALIEQVEYSLKLLLHALYCTSCAKCEILEQAEGWYEATKIKFWLSGLEYSSIFAIMYDGDKASINEWLKKCSSRIM